MVTRGLGSCFCTLARTPSPTAKSVATITAGTTKKMTIARVLPSICGPRESSRLLARNRHTDHSSNPSTPRKTGVAMIAMITYSPWTFCPSTVAPAWAHPDPSTARRIRQAARADRERAWAPARFRPVIRRVALAIAPPPPALASPGRTPSTRDRTVSARHGELEHHPARGVGVALTAAEVAGLPAGDGIVARRQEKRLQHARPSVGGAEVTIARPMAPAAPPLPLMDLPPSRFRRPRPNASLQRNLATTAEPAVVETPP